MRTIKQYIESDDRKIWSWHLCCVFLALLWIPIICSNLFCQFKFQSSLPDRYTVFQLNTAPVGSNIFTDASQYHNTITAYGDTKQSASQKKFGNCSVYFDGTGDYLASSIGDFGNFGTGNFTIDFWIYPLGDHNGGYFGQGSSGSYGWLIDENYNTGHSFRFIAYTTAWGSINTDAASITDNIWYHIAIVRDGNNVYMYKNGNRVSTYNATGKSFQKGTNILNIGCMYNNGTYPEMFYGQNFRISKGVARWTSNFTPPNKQY